MARFLASLAAAALLAAPARLLAHHWLNAGYDPQKTFTLTGVVTKYEWKNPHVLFYVDVIDQPSGKPTTWLMEMGSPNGMVKLGWSKSSLRSGDRVTVEGRPLRNGGLMGYPFTVAVEGTSRRLIAAERPTD